MQVYLVIEVNKVTGLFGRVEKSLRFTLGKNTDCPFIPGTYVSIDDNYPPIKVTQTVFDSMMNGISVYFKPQKFESDDSFISFQTLLENRGWSAVLSYKPHYYTWSRK